MLNYVCILLSLLFMVNLTKKIKTIRNEEAIWAGNPDPKIENKNFILQEENTVTAKIHRKILVYIDHPTRMLSFLAVLRLHKNTSKDTNIPENMNATLIPMRILYLLCVLYSGNFRVSTDHQPTMSTSGTSGLFPSSSGELIDATKSSIFRGDCRTIF